MSVISATLLFIFIGQTILTIKDYGFLAQQS